jgi:hypothetical protein
MGPRNTNNANSRNHETFMVGGDHENLPEFFAGDSDIEYDYYDLGYWIGQSNAGAGVNNFGDIDDGEESEQNEQESGDEDSDDEDQESDDDGDDEEQESEQNEQESGDEDSDDEDSDEDSDDEEQESEQNEQESGDEDSDDDDQESDDETEDTVPYSDDDEESEQNEQSEQEVSVIPFRECLTQADYINLSSFIRSMLLFSFRTLGDALLSFPAYCDIDPASILQLPSDEADKIYIKIYNHFYDPRDAEEDFFENRAVFGLQALADQLQMQMQM